MSAATRSTSIADAMRSARGSPLVTRRRVVQEGADVPVFDRAAEQLAALDHQPRIQNRAVAGRQHGADGPREPRLVRA